MFGIVTRVMLYDGSGTKKVFMFDERMQAASANGIGTADTNARIAFHTTHRCVRESWKYANVDLYNLNDEVRSWIQDKGGKWQNGNLDSNLYLRLDVGWSNFGNYQMWPLYDGNVNSYFVERQGQDDVHHFWCGMLPPLADRVPTKYVGNTPQSARYSPYGTKVSDIIKEKFLTQLWATGYAADHLLLNRSPTLEQLKFMLQSGQFFIDIRFPVIDIYGKEIATQDKEIRTWLNKTITKQIAESPDSDASLKDFLRSEGVVMVDWGMDFGPMSVENEYATLQESSESLGGVLSSTLPETSAVYDKSKFVNKPVPQFYIVLRRGNIRKVGIDATVPRQNIIVNYEMLTQDPQATPEGVQITSLMRPWIGVEDYIKLAIITSSKEDIAKDVNLARYGREIQNYTAGMAGAAQEWMSVWGTKSAVFEMDREALKEKRGSMSFLNVPLLVNEAQHIGDTHGDKWHSQLKTYGPGLTFGA